MNHGLWYEGAAHDDEGRRIGWHGTGGTGRGMCRCGVLSPVLASGYQRKAWHRQHKLDVVQPPVDRLAALIREVDGEHTLGAAALAEALLARGVHL